MKTSFSKSGAGAKPVTPETPATGTATAPASPAIEAPATVTATTPATPEVTVPAVVPPTGVPAPSTPFRDDENIDASDLLIPHLNIVQKVGELSNVHPGGSVILNGQLILASNPTPTAASEPILQIVVIGFRPTRFVEKVVGGLRGNIFDTEDEVVKAGGTLDYNEAKATSKPLYQKLATALILIEQPKGLDDTSFPHEFNGKRYALALYSMKGTAYTNAAKHFFSQRKIGFLREGYRFGQWAFQSILKKFESNYAYIPLVRPGEKTTPEFRAWLTKLLGF